MNDSIPEGKTRDDYQWVSPALDPVDKDDPYGSPDDEPTTAEQGIRLVIKGDVLVIDGWYDHFHGDIWPTEVPLSALGLEKVRT